MGAEQSIQQWIGMGNRMICLTRLGGSEGAEGIMPFPVTLEFDDIAGLRKFVSGRLLEAREKNARLVMLHIRERRCRFYGLCAPG